MLTATNLIYSTAAANRILLNQLGKIFKKAEGIKILKNCVQVTYRTVFGRCSTFLSTKLFKSNFVDHRKNEAQKLEIEPKGQSFFEVKNPEKGTIYRLHAFCEGILCGCEDYRNQTNFYKKGCCKHGYAVLQYLGFNSLSEYTNHHLWVN